MMNWIIRRGKERSTWIGLITLASIAGYSLRPEQQELVVTLGTSLVALLLTFTADQKPAPPEKDWRAPDAVQQQIISTPDIDPNMGIKG